MGQTLKQIAETLRDTNKKVQLIYAFNGTGKTRLSRELKQLIAPKNDDDGAELSRHKILYYNAFTEDLFFWDNDLESDAEHKLKIHHNSFTDWILKDQGQDQNIITNFQHYTDDKLTPQFSTDFSEVTFSLERGTDENLSNLKISKGEESNLIWSVFYTLLQQVIAVLEVAEPDDRETNQFDQLEYVFIDDPVSSLDENHLIELAVNLAGLIKAAPTNLKFIVTTHSPLFYNVLHNELDLKRQGKKEGCYLLERLEDGNFNLNVKYGDANKSFSYHLHLKRVLEKAIAENTVEQYHFTLLRNLYEKTAGFLGYARWSDLLDTVEGSKDAYVRAINTFSHSELSNEQVSEPSPAQKRTVKLLLDNLVNNYAYWKQDEQNA